MFFVILISRHARWISVLCSVYTIWFFSITMQMYPTNVFSLKQNVYLELIGVQVQILVILKEISVLWKCLLYTATKLSFFRSSFVTYLHWKRCSTVGTLFSLYLFCSSIWQFHFNNYVISCFTRSLSIPCKTS